MNHRPAAQPRHLLRIGMAVLQILLILFVDVCLSASIGKLNYNDGFLFGKLRTLKIVRQILPRNDSEQGLKGIDNWLWIILY